MFIAKLLSVKKLINYTLIDSINNYVTHHGNICVTEINKKTIPLHLYARKQWSVVIVLHRLYILLLRVKKLINCIFIKLFNIIIEHHSKFSIKCIQIFKINLMHSIEMTKIEPFSIFLFVAIHLYYSRYLSFHENIHQYIISISMF